MLLLLFAFVAASRCPCQGRGMQPVSTLARLEELLRRAGSPRLLLPLGMARWSSLPAWLCCPFLPPQKVTSSAVLMLGLASLAQPAEAFATVRLSVNVPGPGVYADHSLGIVVWWDAFLRPSAIPQLLLCGSGSEQKGLHQKLRLVTPTL
eukprot:1118715-Pelagomonas_calceolata.AAC.3